MAGALPTSKSCREKASTTTCVLSSEDRAARFASAGPGIVPHAFTAKSGSKIVDRMRRDVAALPERTRRRGLLELTPLLGTLVRGQRQARPAQGVDARCRLSSTNSDVSLRTTN